MKNLEEKILSDHFLTQRRALYRLAAAGFFLFLLFFIIGFLKGRHVSWSLHALLPLLAGYGIFLLFQHLDQKLINQFRITIERLNLALDASGAGTWHWDLASGRVDWDSHTHRLFGLPPNTFGGTFEDFIRLVDERDIPAIDKKIKEAIEKKIPYSVQFRLAGPPSEPRLIQASGRAQYDKNGNTLGMTGLVHDATEKNRSYIKTQELNMVLEERVKKRTEELEGAIQELEAFAYTVSHDLRSPLRAISGFSQALQEDFQDKLDKQGQEYLDRIRRGTNRMGSLIDDILSLSRLSKSPIEPEPVNLTALAEEVAAECRAGSPRQNVEFVIEKNLTVVGDKRVLKIVLLNLIYNASKFSGNEKNPRVEVGRAFEDGRDAFFIKDNGVGFDMNHAGKLFGIFQRLHQAHEFPGNGIGLATVRRLITRHGGEVWAKSQPGKGAVFYFTVGSKKMGEK